MLARKLIGAGGQGGVVLTSGFLDSQSYNGSSSPHSFTNVNFGTADSGRLIVVGCGIDRTGSSTIAAVTIGGVSATKRAEITGVWYGMSVWAATVPTGESGTVIVTGTWTRLAISAIGLYDLASTTPTASAAAINGDPTIVNCNVVGPSGHALGFGWHGPDETLTSTTGFIHQDSQTTVDWTMETAYSGELATATPRAMNFNWSSNQNEQRAIGITYQGN